jgi:hypothetical protein
MYNPQSTIAYSYLLELDALGEHLAPVHGALVGVDDDAYLALEHRLVEQPVEGREQRRDVTRLRLRGPIGLVFFKLLIPFRNCVSMDEHHNKQAEAPLSRHIHAALANMHNMQYTSCDAKLSAISTGISQILNAPRPFPHTYPKKQRSRQLHPRNTCLREIVLKHQLVDLPLVGNYVIVTRERGDLGGRRAVVRIDAVKDHGWREQVGAQVGGDVNTVDPPVAPELDGVDLCGASRERRDQCNKPRFGPFPSQGQE